LPPPESENFAKVSWIISRVPHLNASGGTLLDVGCGGGVFIHTFMNRLPGWQACGVEPTTAYALLARRRLNIPIVNDNYRSGLFGERRFDLISINQVLEHVLDPIKFMKYIRNDISANGYVYLEVPDVSDFENLSSCHDRFMSQHLWFFSKNSLTNICEMAGFVVDHIDVEQTYRGKRNVIALLRLNQTISNAVVRRDDPKEVLAMRDLFHSRQNKETS
jgi:SAM-dependent methyltransferase